MIKKIIIIVAAIVAIAIGAFVYLSNNTNYAKNDTHDIAKTTMIKKSNFLKSFTSNFMSYKDTSFANTKVRKVELDVIGKGSQNVYSFYANGKSQVAINLKVFVDKYDPNIKVDNIFVFTSYNNLNSPFNFGVGKLENGGEITTLANTYSRGVYEKKTRSLMAFAAEGSNLDGQCSPTNTTNCFYALPIYFMADKISNIDLCVTLKNNASNVTNCSRSYSSPAKLDAIAPLQYKTTDFARSRINHNTDAEFAYHVTRNVIQYTTNGPSPKITSFKLDITNKSIIELYCSEETINAYGLCVEYSEGNYNLTGRKLSVFVPFSNQTGYLPNPNMVIATNLTLPSVWWIPSGTDSATLLLDFDVEDEYGNNSKVPMSVCYGDAC